MSTSECDSLVFRLDQLEQNQQVMARYIADIKRQLDSLSEQFNNRPELQQHRSLEDALTQLERQFDKGLALPEAPVEVVNVPPEAVRCVDDTQQQPIQVQSHESQLVFDRSGSRAVLIEALLKAQERLIIVCPWLNRNSIDDNLVQKFKDCLNRNCRIDIGWGHLSDRNRIGIGWRYDALRDLRQLERDYPDHFRLKLLGTHEKFLVCDSIFGMLGSHNMLTSSVQSAEREVGIRTTDPDIIQGLIDRFDSAEAQDVQPIDESMAAGLVSLVNAGISLDVQDVGGEPDSILMELDDGKINQEVVVIEDIPGTSADVEEFLRRYKAGERDFTGINLARAELSNTDFSGAILSEANLIGANLTGANLMSAELNAASLRGAKLSRANLNNAGFVQANLYGANLSGANLLYANLCAADLLLVNLTNANLEGANLAAANLSQSNLRNAKFNNKTKLNGADLSRVKLLRANLQKLNFSGINMSHANLSGAWLCFSNFSGADLTSADLRGADLGGANLEKANLKGANLSGADLDGANLSGAIMPDGTIHD